MYTYIHVYLNLFVKQLRKWGKIYISYYNYIKKQIKTSRKKIFWKI